MSYILYAQNLYKHAAIPITSEWFFLMIVNKFI